MQAWKRSAAKQAAFRREAATTHIEQCKQNVEQALAEYEAAINAAEIWIQAYRARRCGYQGYDEIEMCKAVDD